MARRAEKSKKKKGFIKIIQKYVILKPLCNKSIYKNFTVINL